MSRDLEIPAEVELPITGTAGSIPAQNARTRPDRPMYLVRSGDGWTDVTAKQFDDQVRAVAKGLVARGIAAGAPVAILSPTSYEWTVLDFALWSIGSFAVPIYDSSSAEQIEWILADSGAVAIAVDSSASADRVLQGANPPPMWRIDEDLLAALAAEGAGVEDAVLEQRLSDASAQDIATIVYTSGTTGRPKGCVLTHENLMFVVRTLVATTGPVVQQPGARTVLFLPLAHVLGRGAQVYCALGGMQVAHCPVPKQLPADMLTVRPTFLVGVPRIFEKIFNGSQQKAHAAGKGGIFERAAKVAIDYGRAIREGKPSLWLRAQHALFSRLLYSKSTRRWGPVCDSRSPAAPVSVSGSELLRRHRNDGHGGVRADGDDSVRNLQPRRQRPDRHSRSADARHSGADRRRRRDLAARPTRHGRLPQQPRGHGSSDRR